MARRRRAAFRLAVARQRPEAEGDAGRRARQAGQAAGYPVRGRQEGVAAGRSRQAAAQARLSTPRGSLAAIAFGIGSFHTTDITKPLLGRSINRLEDERFVRGRGRYVADLAASR